MKYKRLTLSFTYEKYSEHETDGLNGYTKNKVYYSTGDFHIYVDSDKVKYGKEKLLKSADKKYVNMISKL